MPLGEQHAQGKQHAQKGAACPERAACQEGAAYCTSGGAACPGWVALKAFTLQHSMKSKISLFLSFSSKMTLQAYHPTESLWRPQINFFQAICGVIFQTQSLKLNYLRFHVRMLCRALLCCSPSIAYWFPKNATLPGHAAPSACSSPAGHAAKAKNWNWSVEPMDHNFVTEGFFLREVFLHLALYFVTLFQKYV